MFESKEIEQITKELKTDLKLGLTDDEAYNRMKQNVKNLLEEEKKNSVIRMFLEQLNDPMIYILLFAVVISILLTVHSLRNTR